jgi:hypothetical protein
MLTQTANGDTTRLSFWLRVREYAVPPSMIETATARRCAGDWAGACAAAGIDTDLNLRSVARVYGRECAARLRDDLRHLTPDLLRWHMPRIAPGPAEIRREELLVALTGTPLPCLQAIDEAHRRPDCLTGVRERLDHGDTAGALAVVEGLLGPDALLRSGELRDELEAAALRRITYGLFRAGLFGPAPRPRPGRIRPKRRCSSDPHPQPRHTTFY